MACRRRTVALSLFAALAVSGCRKKSALEFYALESRVSVLVSQYGSSAYEDPEMDDLLTSLMAIPTDTVEGPKAAALTAQIRTERAKLVAERTAAKAERAAENASAASTLANARATNPEAFEEPRPDAGASTAAPARPPSNEPFYNGMPLADFQKTFAGCVTPDESAQTKGTAFKSIDTPPCRERFGFAGATKGTFRFNSGGQLSDYRYETVVPGATPAPVPLAAPATAAEPPEPTRYVPGGPQPGYQPPQESN